MYVNYLILTILCNVLCVWCYTNDTANFTDHNLWLTIIRNCKDQPSTSCLKKSIYDYLRDTLDYQGDLQFMDFVTFRKNAVNYSKLLNHTKNVNDTEELEGEDELTPLEEISRSLTDNTRKFLMTHDLEIQLPETLFLGSSIKVSPRNFDSSGAEIKFEVIPRSLHNSVGEGRLFKKISK